MNETTNAIRATIRTIDIDLHRDWIAYCKKELVAGGWNIPASLSDKATPSVYLNAVRRLVPARPRAILRSANFSNPSAPDDQAGLAEIERTILAGEDLRTHLSRQLFEADFNDALLNDWDIQHLHLSAVLGNSKRFVKSTGPLLFARFDEGTAYFIDVMRHGDWSRQSIVQILHDNWPDSIAPFRAKNASAVRQPYSDEEISVLRKEGISAMVQLSDGALYLPLGGGYAMSGVSSIVAIQANHIARRLGDLSKYVIDNIDEVAKRALEHNLEIPNNAEFVLSIPHFENGNVCVVEVNSGVAFGLGPL